MATPLKLEIGRTYAITDANDCQIVGGSGRVLCEHKGGNTQSSFVASEISATASSDTAAITATFNSAPAGAGNGGGASIDIDQSFNPSSANPQSGTAVAQAVSTGGVNPFVQQADLHAASVAADVGEYFLQRDALTNAEAAAVAPANTANVAGNTMVQVYHEAPAKLDASNACAAAVYVCHGELVHAAANFSAAETLSIYALSPAITGAIGAFSVARYARAVKKLSIFAPYTTRVMPNDSYSTYMAQPTRLVVDAPSLSTIYVNGHYWGEGFNSITEAYLDLPALNANARLLQLCPLSKTSVLYILARLGTTTATRTLTIGCAAALEGDLDLDAAADAAADKGFVVGFNYN